MGNYFGKVRDGGKLRQQGIEQRQTILPDASIRRVHQYFIEEQVDLRPQARDGLFDRLAYRAPVFVIEILLRAGFEQGFVHRPSTRELRLAENDLDPLE